MRTNRLYGYLLAATAALGLALIPIVPIDRKGGGGDMVAHAVSPVDSGVGVWVFTDQAVYPSGAPVAFTMVVLNRTSEEITLQRNSGQVFDFEVRRGDNPGKVVWNWAHGRFFTMALGTEVLPPGIPRVYTVIWDRRDNVGNEVEAGSYTVRGRYKPGRVDTAPAVFQLLE